MKECFNLGKYLKNYETQTQQLNQTIENIKQPLKKDLEEMFPNNDVKIYITENHMNITLKNNIDPYNICNLGELHKYFEERDVNTDKICMGIEINGEFNIMYDF